MPNLTPRAFPRLLQCDILSQAALEAHLKLYEGYVAKFNELMDKLRALQQRGPSAAPSEAASLRGDLAYALGAIKNHELFFEGLAPADDISTGEPQGELAQMIVKSFHSVPQYLVDLRLTAQHGRGWAWTAYDLDHDRFFNYDAGAQNGLPVWNTVPILTIDLYGHAYFYDYGTNRLAYVDAVMGCLDWEKAAQRLAAVRRP